MSEWIAIKDRLPDKDGRYLVYVPHWNWIGVSSLRQGKFDDTTATHWMILPEKPK
jgi:hypothetical protein